MNDKSAATRLADLIALLLAGGFGLLAWQFAQVPTTLNIILAIILAAGSLRALFEITINRHHVPTIATGCFARRRIAKLLQKHVQPTATIMDLGSGRGELTRTIARALPQATVIGVERATVPHRMATFWKSVLGLKNTTYIQADIFAHDCAPADAVVMFLGTLTKPVNEKLRRELKPGAIIISNEFAFDTSWQPVETVETSWPFKTILLVYRQG